MAELAGTLNVSGQFLSAVQAFDYVQVGRHCTSDYETCALRLACAKFRLAEWGLSVGLSEGAHPDAVFTYNEMMKKRTERLLRQLNVLFDRVRDAQDEYAADLDKSALETYEPARDLPSESLKVFAQLERLAAMRSNVDNAPVTAKPNRVHWTLYEEKAYRRLVADIVELLDELTKQSPESASARDRQRDLCKESVDMMREHGGDMGRLEDIAKKIYGDLYKVITKGTAKPDPSELMSLEGGSLDLSVGQFGAPLPTASASTARAGV